ncbi:MAG TPA: T9SS type A sorting domain-containing protein [Candidatus Kapabacteria bacterium]|nr:T9SS type A sorting domain-containing protein [Candidatus Kapabacteria bacterium]
MKYILLLFFTVINCFSVQSYIDTVYFYKLGTLIYQDSINPYYPNNIFGKPSAKASLEVPEASPEEILSIGIGGEIIVGFKDYVLKDGDGVDFIIFENAFINPVNQGIFAEPAIVSVSSDGVNYIEFPFNTVTMDGFAGINPINGKYEPSQYPLCGGDGFDLATIGMDNIKYIKIRDTSEITTYLDEDNKYYSPKFLVSGFDLDAVAGLYLEKTTGINDDSDIENIKDIKISFNSYSNIIKVNIANIKQSLVEIYDLLGNKVYSNSINKSCEININNYPNGIYILHIINGSNLKTVRILK